MGVMGCGLPLVHVARRRLRTSLWGNAGQTLRLGGHIGFPCR